MIDPDHSYSEAEVEASGPRPWLQSRAHNRSRRSRRISNETAPSTTAGSDAVSAKKHNRLDPHGRVQLVRSKVRAKMAHLGLRDEDEAIQLARDIIISVSNL